MTEDEIVGWYYRFNGCEFEQTLGDSEGQASLVCCSPWVAKSWTCLVLEQQHIQFYTFVKNHRTVHHKVNFIFLGSKIKKKILLLATFDFTNVTV